MRTPRNLTPSQQAAQLGARLRSLRLRKNISQQELALQAGVSRTAVVGAEKGKTQLVTLLAIMQALNMAERANLFIPEQPPSPVQLALLRGKERRRASRQAPQSSTHPKKVTKDIFW
ncbi:helix-turn-helix transcriptional regulator [Chitinibacteraceae bacterium HSL-7]